MADSNKPTDQIANDYIVLEYQVFCGINQKSKAYSWGRNSFVDKTTDQIWNV